MISQPTPTARDPLLTARHFPCPSRYNTGAVHGGPMTVSLSPRERSDPRDYLAAGHGFLVLYFEQFAADATAMD
jgi:hypothetical protein